MRKLQFHGHIPTNGRTTKKAVDVFPWTQNQPRNSSYSDEPCGKRGIDWKKL